MARLELIGQNGYFDNYPSFSAGYLIIETKETVLSEQFGTMLPLKTCCH
jgi:hypothetical protein